LVAVAVGEGVRVGVAVGSGVAGDPQAAKAAAQTRITIRNLLAMISSLRLALIEN
jgi:hypothetical protein